MAKILIKKEKDNRGIELITTLCAPRNSPSCGEKNDLAFVCFDIKYFSLENISTYKTFSRRTIYFPAFGCIHDNAPKNIF